MQEALNLYVEEPEDSKELAHLPDESLTAHPEASLKITFRSANCLCLHGSPL